MTSTVFTPLTLPNGQQLINRIAKAAMEENMGDAQLLPDAALTHLYRRWSCGVVRGWLAIWLYPEPPCGVRSAGSITDK